MKGKVSVCRLTAVLAILLGVVGAAAAQSRGGVIEGRVLDARTGDPLPGATVFIEDSAVSTATDNTGAFRLTGVPPGMHTVLITYLGRKDQEISLTVSAGAVSRHEVNSNPSRSKSSSPSRRSTSATRRRAR